MRTRLDLLIITALAVYRFWRLLARDDITAKWRESVYNRFPPSATRATGLMKWDSDLRENVYRARPGKPPAVSWAAKAFDCPWCYGAWLSVGATYAADAAFGLVWPVMWFLALSCLVGLLGRADAS